MENVHDLNELPVVVVVVVMVPLPAQGHLNQLLHLSRLLCTKGIPVHYVGSAVHNRQAKNRVHGWDPNNITNIHFHDFELPPIPNLLPDPHATNKFPSHLQPTFEASLQLREPVSKLLHNLSSTAHRVVVLHDTLLAFAAKEASSIPNGEAYNLCNVSTFCVFFGKWESYGKPKSISVPYNLPHLSFEGRFPESFTKFMEQQYQFMNFDVGDIYNTCKPIEGTFIDLLAKEELLGNKKQWAVGPLNPVIIEGSYRHHRCLDWLDRQPLESVLYISFGTMTSIPDEQITELAIGLENSEQRFIWVLREADRGNIYEEDKQVRKIQVPDGYEERLEGKGLIVRDWAPQLEILAHPSTGGFLSHCGWNSCMESLSMGVPIAAWPMHSDQPMNAMLVTQVLKIGLIVQDWADREKIIPGTDIENAVRKLMISEEGKDMRKRAKELGIVVCQAASEDGTSSAELNSFINHISRK